MGFARVFETPRPRGHTHVQIRMKNVGGTGGSHVFSSTWQSSSKFEEIDRNMGSSSVVIPTTRLGVACGSEVTKVLRLGLC
jgi:hypothetical protein